MVKMVVPSRFAQFLILVILVWGMAACGPEATRVQGGGPGGDIGNRPAVPGEIEIHGATDPAFNTPIQGEASRVSQP